MFFELLLVGAVLGYFGGLFFILPVALMLATKIRFREYLSIDYVRTRVPQLLAAARVNPIQFALGLITTSPAPPPPPPQTVDKLFDPPPPQPQTDRWSPTTTSFTG
jgi:hypothetical protein